MGRNVNGLNLTAEESAKLACEWTIEDIMEDEENHLKFLLNKGIISRDVYLDCMEGLRGTAESRYASMHIVGEEEEEEEISNIHDSDWDYFQEYLEAF